MYILITLHVFITVIQYLLVCAALIRKLNFKSHTVRKKGINDQKFRKSIDLNTLFFKASTIIII